MSDTFVIIQKTQEDSFFQHINSIDEKIQFTKEASRGDGSMPFLDTLVTINEDGSLNTKVYRKPTHTDLYLQWDSHHSIAAKYSVINTLHYRAKAVCSSKQLLKEEEEHLQKVLIENKYTNVGLEQGEAQNQGHQSTRTMQTEEHQGQSNIRQQKDIHDASLCERT